MSNWVLMICRTVILAALIASRAASALAEPTTAPASAAATSPVVAPPVERATADAVARLYASMAAQRVDDLSLGEVLDRAGAKSRVMAALDEAEQVGGPRAVGDGLVQVSLELRGDRAARIVLDAINQDPTRSPVPPKQLARALRQWPDRAFRSTGDSRSESDVRATRATVERPAIRLPDEAPAWTRDAQTVAAVAPDAGGSLKTARVAEKAAREALREQLSKLPLDSTQTLSAASAKTVDVAVIGAKIASVDYRADGSVQVSVSIDGQQLWELLQFAADR
jgi:hypothetical protein